MKLVWTLLTFTLLFQVSEELRLRKFKRPRGFLFKTKKIKLGRIRNPLRNIGSILKGTKNKPKVSNLRNNLENLISGGIIQEERRNPIPNLKERAFLQDSEPLIPTNVIDVDLQQQQQQQNLEIHPEQQINQHERQVIQEQQRNRQEKEQRQKLRQQKIQDRLQRQKERQLRQQLRQQRFEERQERRRLRQQRQRERQRKRQNRRRSGRRNNNIVDPNVGTFVEAGGVNRDSAGSFHDPPTSIQDQHASGFATHNLRQQPVQHQDSGFNGHRLSHLPCQYVGCVANRVCVMMDVQDPDICDSGTVQACHCARGCVAEYGFLPEGVTKAMGHCRDCTCVNGEVQCIVLDACAHFMQQDPNQGTDIADIPPI